MNGLTFNWPDQSKVEFLVKAANRNAPRSERIVADAKDREARILSVDGASSCVQNVSVTIKVLPRARRSLADGVGLVLRLTLRDQNELPAPVAVRSNIRTLHQRIQVFELDSHFFI
ncbi:hypothetical protein C5H22_09470 [Xylella fastidiosa]|nr:hypothetical protein C5H22_09470 [Xylella fastidiosa]